MGQTLDPRYTNIPVEQGEKHIHELNGILLGHGRTSYVPSFHWHPSSPALRRLRKPA